MLHKYLRVGLVLSALTCPGLLQSPLLAQPSLESSSSTTTRVVAQASIGNYPVINDVDWRSVNAQNIPWSQPVTINDPFDGNYLAVFDRNYKNIAYGGRASLVSEWSRRFIKVHGFMAVPNCAGFLICGDSLADAQAIYLEIKVGGQVFRLQPNGAGTFPVSNQLAVALASAPPGDALIRVTLLGVNQPITSAIGSGTVKAWKVVFAGR